MKHKLLCGLTAAAMTAAILPTASLVAFAEENQFSVIEEGYHYFYEKTDDESKIELTPEILGTFSANWQTTDECVIKSGFELEKKCYYTRSSLLERNYSVQLETNGLAYYGYTGWLCDANTNEPEIEYAIVEGWTNWRPPGEISKYSKFLSGGKQYEIFKTEVTDENGQKHDKYWSVAASSALNLNKMNTINGHINFEDHMNAWEKEGFDVGNIGSIDFFVSGFNSKGSVKLIKNSSEYVYNEISSVKPKQEYYSFGGVGGDTYKNTFGDHFNVGGLIDSYYLPERKEYFLDNYNLFAEKNNLKPVNLLVQEELQASGSETEVTVSLEKAAESLKFCEENGIPLFGGVFVFYSQTPEWFFREGFKEDAPYVTKDVMNSRLESFIKNTFAAFKEEYPDLKIKGYEVCKELFVNDGGGMRPANNNAWMKVYGDDSFVINAYKYARQYAPKGTKLYYSDYNEYMPEKTNDIYNIVKKIMAYGDYIDGIGMEAALGTDYPTVNDFKYTLDKFSSLNLDIMLTEFSVSDQKTSKKPVEVYREILQMCLSKYENIDAVIFDDVYGCGWELYNPPTLKELAEKKSVLGFSFVRGDLNNDNKFSIADVVLMQKYLLKATDEEFYELRSGDFNSDGVIDIFDLIVLKEELLKL